MEVKDQMGWVWLRRVELVEYGYAFMRDVANET